MPGVTSSKDRAARAEAMVAKHFLQAGWDVSEADPSDRERADFRVRRGKYRYAVEIKAGAEGRGDRLIPLWSQAFLQANRAASDGHLPLAIVAAPRISEATAKQVLDFAADHAAGSAVGVFDFVGLWRFSGPGLAQMNVHRESPSETVSQQPTELFSDLNQWLLKVLIAPELPATMLTAPRGRYETVSELARAADVTQMSASRFARVFQNEGYLDRAGSQLRLVRRRDLFAHWQTSIAARRPREVAIRPLFPGHPEKTLLRMTESVRGCLALFSAANALHIGFVKGAPEYIYVNQLDSDRLADWSDIALAEVGQGPSYSLRQAPAPTSIFRGAVRTGRVPTCDALQVWLDVSGHPSRGQEQADLIRKKILAPLFRSVVNG